MPLVWDNHGCLPLRSDSEFLPELSRSGFTREEIDSVMGLNWLRGAEQVWA